MPEDEGEDTYEERVQAGGVKMQGPPSRRASKFLFGLKHVM